MAPSLEKLGIVFAKTGLSPNVWTAIGASCWYRISEWHICKACKHGSNSIGSILLIASGFFDMLSSLSGSHIVGADIVELNPMYDNGATAVIAAKILSSIIAAGVANRK